MVIKGQVCGMRLHREVKELLREKQLTIWNEVVEKVNVDFDLSRKEVWAFVGKRTKGKKKNIILKIDTGVSVTNARGKLEVLLTKALSPFEEDWCR